MPQIKDYRFGDALRIKLVLEKKGLTKAGLFKKHHGKLVSVKASKAAKRLGTLKKWMKKEGVVVKKGTFGLQTVGKTMKRRARGSRRKKRRKRRKSCRYKRRTKTGLNVPENINIAAAAVAVAVAKY